MTSSQREQADASNTTKRTRRPTTPKEIDQFIKPSWETLKQMQEEMRDASEAREYLEGQLYMETTMETNLETLSYALMLFSTTASLRLVQEGARAVALLLRELNLTVRDKEIGEAMKEALTPLTEDLAAIKREMKTIQEKKEKTELRGVHLSYADAAKKTEWKKQTTGAEIKKRQILLDPEQGGSINTLEPLTELQLVMKANEAVRIARIDMEGEGQKILSARKLRNGGLLLEANTEKTASTIKSKKEAFCNAFGPAVKIKERTYTVRIPFVPVIHDTSCEWER